MTAVHLQLLERDKKAARETLAATKKMIDEKACHHWDFEAAELKKQLQA